MKKACIVSIGNELLSGTIADTNSAWLCSRLLSIGIPVVGGYVVPDEMDRITTALRRASEEAEIVIITGGLGPTDDDLTRQAMAIHLNVKLRSVPEAVEELRAFFALRGVPMPQKNLVQAQIPEGAVMLHNPIGTAPGIWWSDGVHVMVSMPGVPSEMMAMFEDGVESKLTAIADGYVIKVRRLHCFGIGESAIAEKIGDLMERGRNPLVNTTANIGAVTLYIVARAENAAEADRMAADHEKLLRGLVGEHIYGTDGQTLAEMAGQGLAKSHKTIAVAESCTGGLLAKMLTDAAGSSRYFTQGWVTYSNDSKIRELGVEAELLRRYGAVSPQVAEAMARGARQKAKTDVSVGITGIAGPDGGTDEKPVGLVYISVDTADGTDTRRFVFMRGREAVRLRASLTALDIVRRKLRFD